MKKGLIVFIIIILILSGIVLYIVLPGLLQKKKDPFATVIKPRIEAMNILIKELDKEKTTMDMKLLVDNPSPIGISLDSLSYQFYIGDTEVMESSYPKGIKMKGNDSTWITLPVTVFNKKLVKKLKGLEEKKIDSVEYRMKSKVYANIPFKDGPLNLDYAIKAPAFVIPKMKVKGLEIKKFGLKESKAIFKTEIENPNPIPFEFKNTSYKVKIDKDKLLEGKIDTAVIIPRYSKKILDFPVEVSLSEAGEAVFRLLVKPSDTDYYFSFKTKLISKSNMLRDSKLFLEDEGKLKDLIKNK
jgi:LEA14-like dessication related protein